MTRKRAEHARASSHWQQAPVEARNGLRGLPAGRGRQLDQQKADTQQGCAQTRRWCCHVASGQRLRTLPRIVAAWYTSRHKATQGGKNQQNKGEGAASAKEGMGKRTLKASKQLSTVTASWAPVSTERGTQTDRGPWTVDRGLWTVDCGPNHSQLVMYANVDCQVLFDARTWSSRNVRRR